MLIYAVATVASVLVAPGLFQGLLAKPLFWIFSLLLVTGIVTVPVAHRKDRPVIAFLGSATTIVAMISVAAVSMFPVLVPSSTAVSASLTIYNASSSRQTLLTMLVIALVGMPVVNWLHHICVPRVPREGGNAHIRTLWLTAATRYSPPMATTTRRGCAVLVVVLASGCSGGGTPPNIAPAPSTEPAPTEPVTSTSAPATSAAPLASAEPDAPPPIDKCFVSDPRVVVPKRGLIRGFDMGGDGRLYWATYDLMDRVTTIFGLTLGDAEAKPEPIVKAKMHNDPDDLVAGQQGFWLSIDDDSRGLCGSRVAWLARTANRAVPLSAPACVFGPKRTGNGAEAIWGTSKTHSHTMQLVVASGPPPKGLKPLGRKVEFFSTVTHADDGVYFALENDEVIRRRPDGGEDRIAPAAFRMPPRLPRAIAVHGDQIYLASSDDLRKVDLFQLPRAGARRRRLAHSMWNRRRPAFARPIMEWCFICSAEMIVTSCTSSIRAEAARALSCRHQTEHPTLSLTRTWSTCCGTEPSWPFRSRHEGEQTDAGWGHCSPSPPCTGIGACRRGAGEIPTPTTATPGPSSVVTAHAAERDGTTMSGDSPRHSGFICGATRARVPPVRLEGRVSARRSPQELQLR